MTTVVCVKFAKVGAQRRVICIIKRVCRSMKSSNWLRRVKLQQLRVAIAIDNNTSLLKAADQVGLSQSAITKIINELEKDIGVELFIRTSKGTHCTEYGAILIAHAKLVFAQLEQAEQEIHDLREGLSGHVTVGTLIAGAASLLPRALAKLQEQMPGIKVTVIEGTYEYLIPLLWQGSLQLIIGRLPPDQFRDAMEVELFYQEEIALIVRPGHPAIDLGIENLRELLQWPWILPLQGTTLRSMIESAFYSSNIEMPTTHVESLSVISNRRLIIESNYIAAFPWRVVKMDVEAGLLCRLSVVGDWSFGPVGITFRRNERRSPAAEQLVKTLRLLNND